MPTAQIPNREKPFALLTLVAYQAVLDVRAFWKENQRYPTVLLAWPLDPTIEYNVVHFSVPEGVKALDAAKSLAKKTSAYALFLLEQQEKRVLLLLETRASTLAISLPIERHGDTRVLGTATEDRNREALGVLWSKERLSN